MAYPRNILFHTRSSSKSSRVLSTSSSSSASSGADSSPSTPPALVDAKDSRTFEHARQRIRRATDLAKTRARKAQGPPRSDFGVPQARRLWERVDEDYHDALLDDAAGSPLYVAAATRGLVQPEPRFEVPLSELLTVKKPRKAKAGDFELVPQVRSVIVLDEGILPDVEVDEPWEHIYADEDDDMEKEKEPSYAAIASLN